MARDTREWLFIPVHSCSEQSEFVCVQLHILCPFLSLTLSLRIIKQLFSTSNWPLKLFHFKRNIVSIVFGPWYLYFKVSILWINNFKKSVCLRLFQFFLLRLLWFVLFLLLLYSVHHRSVMEMNTGSFGMMEALTGLKHQWHCPVLHRREKIYSPRRCRDVWKCTNIDWCLISTWSCSRLKLFLEFVVGKALICGLWAPRGREGRGEDLSAPGTLVPTSIKTGVNQLS